MKCPRCGNELVETAVRCRYCRRPLSQRPGSRIKRLMPEIRDILRRFFLEGKDTENCPWSIVDVIFVTLLTGYVLLKDPLGIGREIIAFLRLHLYICTRDPRLLYYLSLYINTIIFKTALIAFVTISVLMHRAPLKESLLCRGHGPRGWDLRYMLAFLAVSVLFCAVNMTNPLAVNIPFLSVLKSATIIGNAVAIISILIVAPVIEEISFRGFLFPAVNKFAGTGISIVFTSLLFTFAHYQQVRASATFMIIIFALSVLITYARAKTGSTILAIKMHFIYNFVSVLLGFVRFIFF
ncbi:MAG: CPBP family intramembrane glutamic endopeptidase [Candidatus Omnitrophota bacterium]